MKQYIKDGVIKSRNEIVLHVKREVNGKEVTLQVINPREETILADGWMEYIPPEVGPEVEEAATKQREALRLRRSLSDTDYKVIKCMEAYLCGEELPYDIEALHAERNAQRSEINELEGTL